MPLIVSSAVAAFCGALIAWKRRSGRDRHMAFVADAIANDLETDTSSPAMRHVDEVEANLEALDGHFEKLNFHMSINAPDVTLNVVRMEGRFELIFYFDASEESSLYPRVKHFFLVRNIKPMQNSKNWVSKRFALRIVAYPLGNSPYKAATICGEILRTEFQLADTDEFIVRHSGVLNAPNT